MTLQPAETAGWLLQRGLVEGADVVAGRFLVVDASRRNQNYRVTCGNGAGYFVKQVRSHEDQARESFQREAAVHWLAQHDPDFAGLAAVSPRCRGYDADHQVLVLDLEAETRSLAELPGWETDPTVAAMLGARLAGVHWQVGREALRSARDLPLPRRVPWTLALPRLPEGQLSGASPGNREAVRLMQCWPAIVALSADAEQHWRIETFMHGDLKPDNCLYRAPATGTPADLLLVDWELADAGDPAWDVGTVLQSYWLPALLAGAEAGPALEFLGACRTAAATFLRTYLATAGHEAVSADLVDRSLRLAAGRMLQTTYETLTYASTVSDEAHRLLRAAVVVHEQRDALRQALEVTS